MELNAPSSRKVSAALDELIAPISRDEFLREYWNKRTVYIPNLGSSKVALPFGTPDIRTHLAACLRQTRLPLPEGPTGKLSIDVACRYKQDAETSFASQRVRSESVLRLPVPLDKAALILERGLKEGLASYQNLQAIHPEFMSFCTRLKSALAQPGQVHTYLFYHSDAGMGRGLHFDADVTFFIQLAGVRTFRVSSEPYRVFPHEAGVLSDQGEFRGAATGEPMRLSTPPPAELKLDTYDLSAGDVLVFPGGTVHETSSSSESLGLAVAITWFRVREVFTRMFTEHLPRSERPWRDAAPRIGTDISELLSDYRSFIGTAAAQLGNQDELAKLIEITLAREMLSPTGAFGIHFESRPVKPDSILRHHPCKPFVLSESPAGLTISVPEDEFLFDDPLMHAFARNLAAHDRFRVSEAIQWNTAYSFELLRENLQTLVDLGVLVHAWT